MFIKHTQLTCQVYICAMTNQVQGRELRVYEYQEKVESAMTSSTISIVLPIRYNNIEFVLASHKSS